MHFVFKINATAFNMVHSYISQVQFYISMTSSYSTWLFINICTAIYFMYFYLRQHVTKINVLEANINVTKNVFILLSIYEKLPLRTRGTSVSRNFPGNWQQVWKNVNYSFSQLISNTKEPEKNLRKLLQGACGPKRVNRKHLNFTCWNATFSVIFLNFVKMNFLSFISQNQAFCYFQLTSSKIISRRKHPEFPGQKIHFVYFIHNIESFKFKFYKIATIKAFFHCWWR